MNSGLYVRDGACATARLAACAISLFGPTTKDSNVFRGLSPSTLAPVFVSPWDFGKLSFKMTASSKGVCPAGPEGEENLMARGVPNAVTMAACNAVI